MRTPDGRSPASPPAIATMIPAMTPSTSGIARPDDHADDAHPPAPRREPVAARALGGTLRALRVLGRRTRMDVGGWRHAHRFRPKGTGRPTARRADRSPRARPPGRRRPRRRGRRAPARIPIASAPATSCSIESPACTASAGRAPASSSAARNIAPPGFASPISADVSTASTSARSPVRSMTSCSETSQLLTTTRTAPAARRSRRTLCDLGERAEAQRGQERVEQRVVLERGGRRRERGAQDLGAVRAQPREAVEVRRDVVVLAVVGHLRAQRRARAPRPRPARRGRRARPRAAGTGPRARRACRARRGSRARVMRPSATSRRSPSTPRARSSPSVRSTGPRHAPLRRPGCDGDGEREQHEQEAWQRHERLGHDRVGERQRERRDDVGEVRERQPSQAERERRERGDEPGEQLDVVARDDERVPARLREEHRLARARTGAGARPPTRRREPSHAPRNGPANSRNQTSCAANGACGSPPDAHRYRQYAADARRGRAPARARSRARRGPRRVPPEQHERHEQHDARAARRRRQAAEHARPRPAVGPRRVDRADRQHEEQRLAVDRREEERHRHERRREHRAARDRRRRSRARRAGAAA